MLDKIKKWFAGGIFLDKVNKKVDITEPFSLIKFTQPAHIINSSGLFSKVMEIRSGNDIIDRLTPTKFAMTLMLAFKHSNNIDLTLGLNRPEADIKILRMLGKIPLEYERYE